ncbi:MAG: efflux RND transporter permease subunit [Polyangiaceae bacterium]
MTSLSLRNPIMILMLCIGLVVFAGVVTPRMSIDTFPELTPPVLIVGTLAPGLGPKDVEKTISWRLEKYVSATPGVDHVESLSRNNFSVIYVWLKWGTDLNAAQTLVQSQAGFAMAAVPKSLGVLPPFVLQYDPSNAPVIQVVVSGEGYTGPQLYDYAFNNVEPLLEGISGVASAAPDGGRMRQINVVVDPAKAQARNVTANDVAAAVQGSNALLPAGEFIAPKFDANVYTNAIPKRPSSIGEAPVKVVDGRPVLIRDVAHVDDGGTPLTQSVSVNGKEAVYLNVLRVPGGNTIQIVDAVKEVVANLKDLPPGIKVQAFFDQSTFVRTTYQGLKKEIFQALVLIGLVILLFLQSMRGTLIVSVAIPLSFAITLIVLYASGQTLNAFTLGGLTLAMGRLVDDAVVVLESIHRHQRMGMSTRQAALDGANAVALPVLASTLTTMAVLLPVLLLAGLAKKLFAPLALTVAVAMIASYFVSMMVTPVACRYFLGHAEHGKLGKLVEQAIDRLAEGYSRLLRRTLPFRRTIIGASLVLVLASAWAAGRLPSTFFPEIDESMDQIYVRFQPGVSIEEAAGKLSAMGKTLSKELPDDCVKMVIANIGMPQNARALLVSPNVGPHTGYLRIAFTDPEERKHSQSELATLARAILTREFPGVETLEAPGGLVASVFANGYVAPIVVEVRGENLEELESESKAIADVARTVPGIRDVKVSLQLDYPELHVETDREKAGLVGVTLKSAAESTLEATLGNINTPGVWIDASNGQSYYVVTFYEGSKVADTQQLAALPVRVSDEGRAVLLGAYAGVHRQLGPIAVERNHLERAAHVLMITEGRDMGRAGGDLEKALHGDARTRNIHWSFAGQIDLMRTTFSGLGLALGLAVMVVFMIMASQFKSLRLPFVMLFTIPVSLVGIVLALMGAGQGFSITALMGILMVIGIAVSNGILLVDDANRRFLEGADKVDAIVAGARSRFVPIVMTSLATVIGLIPTAMALERGSEANQPLALAVVGGLTSSTLLSLFLVPVMFLFFATKPAADAEEEAHGAPLAGAHA